MTLYGFYSEEAVRKGITSPIYYNTPEGGIVKVTCVSKDPNAPGYLWPDKVRVGEVTTMARVQPSNSSQLCAPVKTKLSHPFEEMFHRFNPDDLSIPASDLGVESGTSICDSDDPLSGAKKRLDDNLRSIFG